MFEENYTVLQDKLRKVGACNEAVVYAGRFDDPLDAWNSCTRPDWLVWILARMVGEPGWPEITRMVGLVFEAIALTVEDSIGGKVDDDAAELVAARVHKRAALDVFEFKSRLDRKALLSWSSVDALTMARSGRAQLEASLADAYCQLSMAIIFAEMVRSTGCMQTGRSMFANHASRAVVDCLVAVLRYIPKSDLQRRLCEFIRYRATPDFEKENTK